MRISKLDYSAGIASKKINQDYINKNSENSLAIKNSSSVIMNNLSAMASLNKLSFKAQENLINLSLPELRKRTSPEYFAEYRMLDVDAPEYLNLHENDKKALKHLVKAARILDSVYLKQDNSYNLKFKKQLEDKIKKGNKSAQLALKLFNAQKGVSAKDVTGKEINLSKTVSSLPQRGFYPDDLTEKEFHNILINMLENGETDEVKKILNQRSMVVRDGDKLSAVEYGHYFNQEFTKAALEIYEAAYYSTNEDFAEFLELQATALLSFSPLVDAMADKKWATLQDTPLEFTITRESYDDRLTPTVNKNKKLKKMLDEAGIIPYAKDNIGVRVGIVDKKGTDYLLKVKDYLPLMAKNMPFNDEYEQNIKTGDNKQSMVDVDIVEAAGQLGAYRGAISLASNLPNGDKLAVQTGGGHRTVYHKQMRKAKYSNGQQKRLDALLDKSQHKYFDVNALHDFTILHENLHSLGPKKGLEKLGLYKNTIEENKADIGAIVMFDVLKNAGVYTEEDQKKFLTTYFTAYVLKGPDFENAHKLRNIMQHNYFIKEGAIDVDDNGKMKINYEKVTPAAQKMFNKIIRLQLDGSILDVQEYIAENAMWSPQLEKMSKNVRDIDKVLNSYVTSPLADKLMQEEI